MEKYVFGEQDRLRAKEILYMIYEKASDTRDIEAALLEPSRRDGLGIRQLPYPNKNDFKWVSIYGMGKRRLLKSDDLICLDVLYEEPEIIVKRTFWPYGSKVSKTEVLYRKNILAHSEESIVQQVVAFMKNYFRDINSKRFWGN